MVKYIIYIGGILVGKELDEKVLKEVFLYDLIKDKNEFYHSDNDLAYYTSASTLYSILDNKEVWLRSTMCMNDYQEIRYAASKLKEILRKNNKKIFNQFIEVLEQILSGKITGIRDILNDILTNIAGGLYLHTYIMCFTEHDDSIFPDGNLQMFNSYGRGNGACLIFDKNKLQELDLPIYKVHYSNEKIIENKLTQLLNRLDEKAKELRGTDVNEIINYLKLFFISLITTTKHPGFWQENEWRLIINDRLIQYDKNFKNVQNEKVKCVNDIPQIIKTLKLNGYEQLLKKIILEPRYTMAAEALAIIKMLKDSWNIDKPADIIRVSEIPVRR